MRAAVLLIVILLAIYGAWQFASPAQRATVKSFLGRHVWAIASIVGLVLLALLLAAHTPATNIL